MALSNNGKKILIWSTLITMLGVGGYYGYKWFMGRDKPSGDQDEDPSPTTTPTTPPVSGQNATNDSQPFKTEAEVKAFQKWVINIKGDKTILGKGGDSGFGDDGKWGRNSKNAWAKYGEEYKKTFRLDADPENKPSVSSALQKDIDIITQFGKGDKAKESYLKSGTDKQSKKDWIKAWANAIRQRTNDATKGTTFVWATGGQDWGLYEAFKGEKILKYNPKGKSPSPLARARFYKNPKVSVFDYVGASGSKIGTIQGYTYNKNTKKLWLYVPKPFESVLSDAYIFGNKWILADDVKFA
jgi:hypothetical protein